jgi:hypothetical protein
MGLLAAWVGFVGGWLLVAGPVYQALLELQDEEVDHERLESLSSSIPKPDPVTRWWWLLPPVYYALQRRRSTAYRRAVFDAMGPAEVGQTIRYLDKAAGWLLVAAGAFLIGVKETWELVEHSDWPVWLFCVLIVASPLAGIAYAFYRLTHSRKIIETIEADDADPAAQ